jgi:hypothetical protein
VFSFHEYTRSLLRGQLRGQDKGQPFVLHSRIDRAIGGSASSGKDQRK